MAVRGMPVVRPDMVDDGDGDGDELDRDSDLYQSPWSRFERPRVHAGGVATSLRVKVGQIAETIARVADGEDCPRGSQRHVLRVSASRQRVSEC